MISQDGTNKHSRHARDVFHAWMLEGADYAGALDLPILKGVHVEPARMVAASDAMKPSWNDYDCFVHFFEDDCLIERFWNNTTAYNPKLSRFQGVIGLDYSAYYDFFVALMHYNHLDALHSTRKRGICAVVAGQVDLRHAMPS